MPPLRRREIHTTNAARNDAEPPPQLEVDDMLDIHKQVIRLMKNPATMFAKQLATFREHLVDKPIIFRWQSVIAVWMGSVLHIAVTYGYPNEQKGVEQFMQAYENLSRNDPRRDELTAATKERWNFLFKQGLGMDIDDQYMPLEEARTIVKEQCMRMQDDAFLKTVEDEMTRVQGNAGSMPEEQVMAMRQEALLGLLQPLQMGVYAEHGFEGDKGFITMQAALLNHHGDDQITYNTAVATTIVFQRAGMMPNQ